MNNVETPAATTLHQVGLRATAVKLALLRCFTEHASPCTIPSLLETLEAEGLTPNKTTLYRDITQLEAAGFIEPVTAPGRATAYKQRANEEHHHHLLCRHCNAVIDVMLPDLETALQVSEQHLAHTTGAHHISHDVTFTGSCETCFSSLSQEPVVGS